MKTPLISSLLLALGALSACSSDEGGTPRTPVGDRTPTGSAGGGATPAAGGAGSTPANPLTPAATGGTGAAAVIPGLGESLAITEDGVVTDPTNGTAINGGIAVTQSSVMTEPATISTREGGLCFKGVTATVPDSSSYGTHWGAEMIFDLNRGANPDAPADGADAGNVLGMVAQDWPQGDVIGFAYTLVGNDTTAADQGVPAEHVRFKATPVGANTANDNYCSNRTPASGVRDAVLFSDITFECWTPGNYTLAEDPIQFVQTPDPNKMVGTRPNPKAFRNISWQISSDLNVDPIKFDFCVTDLRPILAP